MDGFSGGQGQSHYSTCFRGWRPITSYNVSHSQILGIVPCVASWPSKVCHMKMKPLLLRCYSEPVRTMRTTTVNNGPHPATKTTWQRAINHSSYAASQARKSSTRNMLFGYVSRLRLRRSSRLTQAVSYKKDIKQTATRTAARNTNTQISLVKTTTKPIMTKCEVLLCRG